MNSFFWYVHVIMNTSGLLQGNFARDPSIHESANIQKSEFIAYNYILL